MSGRIPLNVRGDIDRLVEKQRTAITVTYPTIEIDIIAQIGDEVSGGYQLTADTNFISQAGDGGYCVRLPELNQLNIGRIVRISNRDQVNTLSINAYFGQFFYGTSGFTINVVAEHTVTFVAVSYNNWLPL